MHRAQLPATSYQLDSILVWQSICIPLLLFPLQLLSRFFSKQEPGDPPKIAVPTLESGPIHVFIAG